jgi:hypothetical protein
LKIFELVSSIEKEVQDSFLIELKAKGFEVKHIYQIPNARHEKFVDPIGTTPLLTHHATPPFKVTNSSPLK